MKLRAINYEAESTENGKSALISMNAMRATRPWNNKELDKKGFLCVPLVSCSSLELTVVECALRNSSSGLWRPPKCDPIHSAAHYSPPPTWTTISNLGIFRVQKTKANLEMIFSVIAQTKSEFEIFFFAVAFLQILFVFSSSAVVYRGVLCTICSYYFFCLVFAFISFSVSARKD